MMILSFLHNQILNLSIKAYHIMLQPTYHIELELHTDNIYIYEHVANTFHSHILFETLMGA
jgi:hypothetical protein